MQILSVNLGSEYEFSGRTKSRETLRNKLITFPDMRLDQVRDIVGARISLDCTLDEQDALAERIEAIFAPDTKLFDRRADPRCGYRALHVRVRLDGIYAEIQIRTSLQTEWANTFEDLADKWGRQIRYGEEPNGVDENQILRRKRFIQALIKLSEQDYAQIEEYENTFKWAPGATPKERAISEQNNLVRLQALGSLERIKILAWEE